MSTAPAGVDAWQAALAAEHEAVFGYGLLGPRLTGVDRQLALASAAAHTALRDATRAAMAAAAITPKEPLVDYPALYRPAPPTTPSGARSLAVRLEDGCATAWRVRYLAVADSVGADPAARANAQRALTASAVRAMRWRVRVDPARATLPFPGISVT